MADKRLGFRLADDGRDQPARDRHGDADVGVLVLQHRAFGPRDVGLRHAHQRQRQRLDDEVIDRDLVGGLAVLVLGRGVLICSRSARRASSWQSTVR